MLSKLRIWIGATALAVLATSGGVAQAQADEIPPTPPFTDVATSHTFFTHISWLAERGISTGYGTAPNRTFQPAAPVLREQMAAFLYRLAGSPTYTAPATSPFTDVSTSHVFYRQISWLSARGISTGYDLGGGRKEFRPGQPVLREQMAAFLFRFEGGTPHPQYRPNESRYFFQDAVFHAFEQQIRWMGNWEISTGYTTSSPFARHFRPGDPVLREQMAAFMFRLDHTLPPSPPQISMPASAQLDVGSQVELALVLADDRTGTWSTSALLPLPPGLTLDGARITGQPTTVGTWVVDVIFTDQAGRTAEHRLTISVGTPADSVTRSDLATYLYVCADQPPVTRPTTSPFTDLDADDLGYDAALWSRQAGLMSASGTTFRPDHPVTNADLAQQLYSYKGSPAHSPQVVSPFLDVSTSHPQYHFIDWVAATGTMRFDSTGRFYPDRPVSQAELDDLPYPCLAG
ncbi:S-layer homology domain-containing protein [Aeromicrobium alkaliterrae]|uniref:S-layer homology domain-containing protein n=1 Tax=Aeromicrobium alkaliterrae TaxID=302168 RepID=UPI0031D0020A